MRKKIHALALMLILSSIGSCTQDIDYYYARYGARFQYRNVLNTIPLRNALNQLGMYCTIVSKSNEYVFTDSEGNTQPVPKSYVESLAKPIFIAGLIVGYTASTDIKGQHIRVAHDLACPNCYEKTSIRRSLSIGSNHTATCGRCGCAYDLETGNITKGDTDIRRLFTYHITYSDNSNDVFVNN